MSFVINTIDLRTKDKISKESKVTKNLDQKLDQVPAS